MNADQAEVLETLTGFIQDVMGDELDDLELDGPITLNTSFADDLELESIEFVSLSEQLQGHYGDQVDFVGWISEMELDQIITLRVGDLVEFIVRCRS